MAVAPNSVDILRDALYRIGGMNPEGFYTQSQLNNNMSGNDANAIYYATHDQGFNPNDPMIQAMNAYRAEGGYKPDTGAYESNPVYGDHNAYVTGAGAAYHPVYDEALPQGVGSAGGISPELLQPEYKDTMNRVYANLLQQLLPGQR